VQKPQEEEIEFNKQFKDTEGTKYDVNLNLNEIIPKLKKERATEYNSWLCFDIALINLYCRKILIRGQSYDMYDLFSSKADNYMLMVLLKC
jgi:hypothetical protein